ncbi:MAG: hypothetical protein Nkreftii_002036 [Candidatus Nitrospira kreftii]|uniref:DUF5666 domain-containing protein n=1 Tax=Candidatus Nitrospira kreftii TaxID=2652173 RepID=A0A7S8IYP3_9BACT|nr:MAG: hypothetical protein Nkreftii_002036 [Candidatus Nitrospira kreftii]
MNKDHQKFHFATIGGLTAMLLAAPSFTMAGQQHEKKAAAASPSSPTESHSPAVAHQSNNKPGPAWRTIGGTVKHMKDTMYTIEDYDGNQVQLFVSRETKQMGGRKKVGDHVRAEITHSGFANSIQ